LNSRLPRSAKTSPRIQREKSTVFSVPSVGKDG
jgi:hypothetical protein